MLSQNLNDIILRHAKYLSDKLGFTYIPDVMAPSNFKELKSTFNRCRHSKLPMPVYSGSSENTIYGVAEVNYALRFWHDIEHVLGNNDFSLNGEIHTAYRQLATLEYKYGCTPQSIEWKFLHADIVGQIQYYFKHKQFVQNQAEFCLDYIRNNNEN